MLVSLLKLSMQVCAVPVVSHVTLDEVSGGESGHQRELSGQNRATDDPRQRPRVLTGTQITGAVNSQHLTNTEQCLAHSLPN